MSHLVLAVKIVVSAIIHHPLFLLTAKIIGYNFTFSDLTPPPPQKKAKKETKPKKDPQQKSSATGKDGKR